MGWRTVIISKPARLSIKDRQLCVNQEDTISVPLEDISVLLIESMQVEITGVLLSHLAEYQILLFSCDGRHVPNGCFMPFASHSRHTLVAKAQLNMSMPFKKRLWQRLVQQKIFNQAKCLDLFSKSEASFIFAIGKEVLSGDSNNREAYAARLYFLALFGEKFNRFNTDWINAALNYGYTILRGVVARAVTIYGFIPCLGLQHDSELNNFNLADDLIEPFRPIVDLWVANNVPQDLQQKLTKEDRTNLVNLLHHDLLVKEQKHSVLNAIDKLTGTFSTAMQAQDIELLHLPELIVLNQHIYE